MTLADAIAQGITRVRQLHWSDPEDYLALNLIQNKAGGYEAGLVAHLWARRTQQVIGEPTPQLLLLSHALDPCPVEPYRGWLDPEDDWPTQATRQT